MIHPTATLLLQHSYSSSIFPGFEKLFVLDVVSDFDVVTSAATSFIDDVLCFDLKLGHVSLLLGAQLHI